jgi:hypothetical protein
MANYPGFPLKLRYKHGIYMLIVDDIALPKDVGLNGFQIDPSN